jgi:hypothetical protein
MLIGGNSRAVAAADAAIMDKPRASRHPRTTVLNRTQLVDATIHRWRRTSPKGLPVVPCSFCLVLPVQPCYPRWSSDHDADDRDRHAGAGSADRMSLGAGL